MLRPIILVVGREKLGLDRNMSYHRDGFCFYIQEHFKCEALIFDSIENFEDAIEEVEFLHRIGRLIMAIIIQCRYIEDEHLPIAKLIRKKISHNLKIVNIKNIFSTKNIRGYWFDDKRLIAVIQKQISNYKPKDNYFGIESKKECNLLISQLDKAYWKNYSETISPTNDQVVLEALRLRLLPPGLIKEEFDNALHKDVVFGKVPLSVYEAECQIIKNMSLEEKDNFWQSLVNQVGSSGSYGDEVSALAIDPETLVYSISSGWGNHIAAKINTENKIKMFTRLKEGSEGSFEEEKEIELRIIEGLITFAPIFQTPILRIINDGSEIKRNILIKIGKVFIEKREFIPVDWDMNLLQE